MVVKSSFLSVGCYVVSALVALFGGAPSEAADSVTADILLKGGTIFDGSGNEGIVGDVAISGDRIVGVGTFPLKGAKWEIDCRGLVIAPGFIDLHTHCDGPLVRPATRANVNYLMQGCTTVVTGNCGSGPVDVAEFYDKIDAAGAGTNVVHLLPQGSVRSRVMGTAERKATVDELAEMKRLAEQGMKDGAWGMSTGLIYVPSSYADTNELVEIARVVAAHGGIHASHIRNENTEVLEAVNEVIEIGRRAALPTHISHFKSSGRDAWGLVRRAAEAIEMARQSGQIITADQYPYIASSTSLDAMLIPTWARAGGRKALIARFDDPNTAERLKAAMAVSLKKREGGRAMRIASYSARRDWVGKNLAEIAQSEGKDPLDLAIQISRNGGASIVNFSMSEQDVRHIMQIPWVATGSDGRSYVPSADRPHPRSYGTFSRKVGYYAIGEKVLPLAQAIRSATGLPAEILGITDRGYLKVGTYADVTVFDPDAFIDKATFDAPHQYSQGVECVFVNGRPSVFAGIPTGALAGRALRHGRPDKGK